MGKSKYKCSDYRLPCGPVEGLVLSIAGQQYTFTRMDKIVLEDGLMYVSVWVAPCRNCSESFVSYAMPRDFPGSRNCEKCISDKRSAQKLNEPRRGGKSLNP